MYTHTHLRVSISPLPSWSFWFCLTYRSSFPQHWLIAGSLIIALSKSHSVTPSPCQRPGWTNALGGDKQNTITASSSKRCRCCCCTTCWWYCCWQARCMWAGHNQHAHGAYPALRPTGSSRHWYRTGHGSNSGVCMTHHNDQQAAPVARTRGRFQRRLGGPPRTPKSTLIAGRKTIKTTLPSHLHLRN